MTNEYSKEFCYQCMEDFDDSDAMVECPACGRVYHKSCYEKNGCVGGKECENIIKASKKAKKENKFKNPDETNENVLCAGVAGFKTLAIVLVSLASLLLIIALAEIETALTMAIVFGGCSLILYLAGIIFALSNYSVTVTEKKIIVKGLVVPFEKTISNKKLTDVHYRGIIPKVVICTSGKTTVLLLIGNAKKIYETVSYIIENRDK